MSSSKPSLSTSAPTTVRTSLGRAMFAITLVSTLTTNIPSAVPINTSLSAMASVETSAITYGVVLRFS